MILICIRHVEFSSFQTRFSGHNRSSLKVIVDSELAALYDAEPRALTQTVLRSANRFQQNFMFQLSGAEAPEIVICDLIEKRD
jgi:ORF6N domain-containing protein